MRRFAICLALSAALALPASAAPYGDKTIVLKLRPNVTLTYYFTDAPVQPRRGAVILFVGGAGVLAKAEGNFLLRAWTLFLHAGYAVAIPDVPTDHPHGLLGSYRSSFEHAAGDIRGVVYDVRDRVGKSPIWLIGTSRGSISAASGGAWLSPSLTGIVLTSTVAKTDPDPEFGADTVFDVPLGKITIPALLLGHAKDTCAISLPQYMENIREKLSGTSVKKIELVEGGLSTTPAGLNPCQAKSPHGFWDSEAEAVHHIVSFMKGITAN